MKKELIDEAKQRAFEIAKKLKISVYNLRLGGRLKDWTSTTYLKNNKISIMR